jgi:hypothetical protein
MERHEKANPTPFAIGRGVGGAAIGMAASPASAVGATLVNAGLGAAEAAGASEATDAAGIAKDALKGAGLGLAGGAVGAVAGRAISAAAAPLAKLGRARLFKAAVGQNKRAFTQMNGKQLFDKAGEYLDAIGIGFGDTTESIGAQLAKRSDELEDSLGGLVQALDAGGAPRISPVDVAIRIEKEVAEPLKKLAANQGEYAQVVRQMENIVDIGRPLTFAEAAAQRRAVQQQINYDRVNKLEAAAEAKQKIAQIWNDVIDEQAMPLLKSAGIKGDAYRELRHEYALVRELKGHVDSRIQSNAANRVVSPSDYGLGGAAGILAGATGHDSASAVLLGLAAATANHLGRVYGNAAAGRGAINIAKMAAAQPRAMRVFVPAAARAAEAKRKAQEEADADMQIPVSPKRGR